MSRKLVKNNNMDNVTFEALGMDISQNFLKSPKAEGKKYFMRTEDIKQTSGDLLMEQDFSVGGILIFKKNGDVLFTLKKGQTNNDILFCTLDMSNDSVERCNQVLQESLNAMEKELGMEAGYLDLKHCGVMVEIADNTYKVIEE